jgi:hypothetical protein
MRPLCLVIVHHGQHGSTRLRGATTETVGQMLDSGHPDADVRQFWAIQLLARPAHVEAASAAGKMAAG